MLTRINFTVSHGRRQKSDKVDAKYDERDLVSQVLRKSRHYTGFFRHEPGFVYAGNIIALRQSLHCSTRTEQSNRHPGLA